MAYSAVTPTSTAAFGNISRTGDSREGLAREVEACSSYIVQAKARLGTIPASGSTNVTAATTVTLALSAGNLRTISTVGLAGGMTVSIQTTGAVQGERFVLCKIATGGTGAVTVDSHAFTTKKKFNCELIFVNGAWRMTGYYEYA